MQHDSCEEIQLLISRLVDDEVSPSDRERVEQHVAICDECAYKMLEFMEMAVLFSETPLRQPDPQLRSALFREIGNVQEEARLKEEASRPTKGTPWLFPPASGRHVKRAASSTFARKLLQVASPFAVAAASLFVFLGALFLGNRYLLDQSGQPVVKTISAPPALSTRSLPVDVPGNSSGDNLPPPVETKIGLTAPSPAAPSTSYVNATATLGRSTQIQLMQPTPVLEDGDAGDKSNWHTMRDPEYGYTIGYPPNWWTYVAAGVRYFYPWTTGGTRYAPYWVEMRVSDNSGHLSADNANARICGGNCEPVRTPDGSAVWLRRMTVDVEAGNSYDEAYLFDNGHIYQFRVTIPTRNVPGAGDFQERIASAESIFGLMSGRLVLAGDIAQGDSTFGGVLFLNGADVWLAYEGANRSAFRVTRGYRVLQFAQSPDLTKVAFAAADPQKAADPWASSIYLTFVSSNGPVEPALLLSGMEIHDIAWYSDHELLALARTQDGVLGIYKLSAGARATKNSGDTSTAWQVERLVTLPAELSGAKSLAVSPDRQLITFLAPVGEKQGTDIYAVRPDGTDLIKVVSHSDPVSPLVGDNLVLAPESQAIKSYLWADGHLEPAGYEANLLFTCGNSLGYYQYPGGFLYSTSGSSRNPLVDPTSLINNEPERMQIIGIALSPQGKVAMAGYKTDVNGRADQIVGLWTGEMAGAGLQNLRPQPLPELPDGVTDMQWTPDGKSLVYRETIPLLSGTVSSRYDGNSDFRMVELDTTTGKTLVLYDGVRH